ncbi:hypothetical protein BDW59DRAFT_142518 [Aspergillus cavernicola]|uniref:Uncharacterized protein n=1 Tax=Aspergillus cavernicola TaxID=176166 RepID=A0ABR4IML8_9EURO
MDPLLFDILKMLSFSIFLPHSHGIFFTIGYCWAYLLSSSCSIVPVGIGTRVRSVIGRSITRFLGLTILF